MKHQHIVLLKSSLPTQLNVVLEALQHYLKFRIEIALEENALGANNLQHLATEEKPARLERCLCPSKLHKVKPNPGLYRRACPCRGFLEAQ